MSMITSERRRQVPAVSRAVAILRHLGRSAEPLGVNQIARDLELVPSTCLHILRVLNDEGLVAFDRDSKRYSIDVGILSIARAVMQRNGFITLAEPRLTALSTEFGVTAVATRLADAEHMIVVAISNAALPFRLQVDMGSRFPALISATGRCHAAFNLADLGDARLRVQFSRLNWDQPPPFDEWKRDVERTRTEGFAVDRGRYIGGVTIVAVPFLDRGGHMTHSLVSIGISERISAIGIQAVTDAMMRARDDIDAMLPGTGS